MFINGIVYKKGGHKMKASDSRYREIDQALQVFSFRQVQALLTLTSLLEIQDITVEEVKDFVEARRTFERYNEDTRRRQSEEFQKMWEKYARRCPDCKDVLMLRSITIPKGPKNVNGYTSQWFCQTEGCTFEDYGYEDAQEVQQKIMEGTYNADN